MAKTRTSRDGVLQHQITVWICDEAFKAAQKKLTSAKQDTGIANITLSALCGSALETVFTAPRSLRKR